ncbi:MAG: DUF1127 domain-containing protein [Neomegalonema sp.]|nr:DUF1127 domain-containing protein [Neomegalonema sp.]
MASFAEPMRAPMPSAIDTQLLDLQALAKTGYMPSLAASAIWAAHVVAIWSVRRRTRRELAMLDRERLCDIGLTREAQKAESAKPFWKA